VAFFALLVFKIQDLATVPASKKLHGKQNWLEAILNEGNTKKLGK
jgi:hypothetical protein